jgi:rod shape-determining protein MreD
MNKLLHLLFAVVIIAAQKFIFEDPISVLYEKYPIYVFIYPLIILRLPIGFDRPLSLILSFTVGLLVDILSDTLGMNAFALLIMTYMREPILKLIEPRQGYKPIAVNVKSYGFLWIIAYLAILMFINIVAFFVVDAFTLVFVQKILMSSVLSLLASIPFGLLILFLFKVT